MGVGGGGLACPRGSPMLARFMWTHTHTHTRTLSAGIEYDPLVSKMASLIYTHQGFKGSVKSAEIEALTGALDSFSLTLF